MTLEMLKSDPAQNAIADNLDDDDDDMEMSILMNMREFKKIAMKMVQPWREVQRGRRWKSGLVWRGSSTASTCSPCGRSWRYCVICTRKHLALENIGVRWERNVLKDEKPPLAHPRCQCPLTAHLGEIHFFLQFNFHFSRQSEKHIHVSTVRSWSIIQGVFFTLGLP